MTQGPITGDSPVAVIEGPKGKAEIFEYLTSHIIEYKVKFENQTKTFNNLGEAYLEAEDLSGKTAET
jgi:hypothetical protein